MNLEESEKLIKEALDLDKKEKEKLKKEGKIDEVKENAAYLDSLGWVLFKQKKYKEALEPLKKAAADEDDGNHLEIWDHLADCHMALGQKKEAIAAWEKALKMEDLSKRDGERRRKVSEKLKKAKDREGGQVDAFATPGRVGSRTTPIARPAVGRRVRAAQRPSLRALSGFTTNPASSPRRSPTAASGAPAAVRRARARGVVVGGPRLARVRPRA